MIIDVDTARFAAAFADAVLNFIATDTPQQVYFDSKAEDFGSCALEPGTTPEDVDLYVSDGWDKLVSGVTAADSKDLSPDQLRKKIVSAVTNSAEAEQWIDWLTDGARLANEAI